MAREPASIRTKNPGAMWPGPIATKWGSTRWIYLNDGTGQGGNGKGNKIAIFDNWLSGICAQLDLWRSSKNYKNKRLADALYIWSGKNNYEAYIAHVCRKIPGMTRNTIMDDAFWRGPYGLAFLKVQASHEAGKPYPAPDIEWAKAQQIVFSGWVADIKPTVKTSTKTAATVTTTAAPVVVAAASSFPWLPVVIGVVVVAVAAGVAFYFWRRHEAKKQEEAERPAVPIEAVV